MGVKVAATCLHCSQSIIPHSLYNSHPFVSTISSPSKRRNWSDRVLLCRFFNQSNRLSLFRTTSTKLLRFHSSGISKFRGKTLIKACNASLDGFSDEEFSKEIQELALSFKLSGEDEHSITSDGDYSGFEEEFLKNNNNVSPKQSCPSFSHSKFDSIEPHWLKICPDPPVWPEREEIIYSSIERKANKIDLPLSLRIIKRKKQWEEGFREVGESAYCSAKRAFSSMVFMIRELQSYTLQMREVLFFQDLQGIVSRVEKEMQASFVWLFQQVFSHTPTLMVYVMILLANFTVHSMAHNTAIAASPPLNSQISIEYQNQSFSKNNSSAMKTFSASSSIGKRTSIGGSNGGGGKTRPISSGTDGGDGWFDGYLSTNLHHTFQPDEISQLSSFVNRTNSETSSGSELDSKNQEMVVNEEEVKLWDSVMEEASRMQDLLRDKTLDHETMKRFVSPVKVEIEPEDYVDYLRTDLLYQLAVSQEPQNCLLLCNYAQFLYLVFHEHDRAEMYFNRALRVEPSDAEALSRYASFLWLARKDIGAAEKLYLEAIAADPGNTFHAANYAHFLWNTGGEDTCYTLDPNYTNTTNDNISEV